MKRYRFVLALLLMLAWLPVRPAGATVRDYPNLQSQTAFSDWGVSPDGRWIYYQETVPLSHPRYSPFYRYDFYIMPFEGGTSRLIGSVNAMFVDWRWRPDSRGLVLLRREGYYAADQQILSLTIDGTSAIPITTSYYVTCTSYGLPARCQQLSLMHFSSDGNLIYRFDDGTRWLFYRTLPSGGAPSELLGSVVIPDQTNVAESFLQPSGWIVCRVGDQIIRIATVGAPRQDMLFETPSTFNYPLIFGPDGRYVLAWSRPAPTNVVELYSIRIVDQPAVVRLLRLENWPDQMWAPSGAVISPDSRYALINAIPGDPSIFLALMDGPADTIRAIGGSAPIRQPYLISYLSPVFSPDGRWVFYQGGCGPGGMVSDDVLCRYDLASPEVAPIPFAVLPPGAEQMDGLQLTASGNYVIYKIVQANQGYYYSALAAGAPLSASLLAGNADPYTWFSLKSSLGDAIVALLNNQIQVLHADGSRPVQTVQLLGADERIVRWVTTPDGRMLYVIERTTPNGIDVYARLADLGILRGGFATPALCVNEQAGSIRVPVILETAPVDTRTITHTITGGTAGASDYTLAASGNLLFGPGERTRMLDIPVVDDGPGEGSETITLHLSADPASILIAQADLTLTIREQGECQASLPLAVRP